MVDLHSKTLDRLFAMMMELENLEEYYCFFEDLCTIQEIREMGQRLEIAILLENGKSYQEISAQTGISAATISRVSKCLKYGAGGYRNAITKWKERSLKKTIDERK